MFNRQPPTIQAAFQVALETLERFPRKFWRQSLFEELGQNGQTVCRGLARVKIIHKPKEKDGKELQERILAFEGPGDGELTLLLAFCKDDDPDYSKSCPEAQERKVKAQDDPENRTQECRI